MANKGVRKRSGKRTRKETWTETERETETKRAKKNTNIEERLIGLFPTPLFKNLFCNNSQFFICAVVFRDIVFHRYFLTGYSSQFINYP